MKMASVTPEHVIKVWKTEHGSEMDVCYSCICFSDLGQHFLICFGESFLPYSQTTVLSVKLILLLGPREQCWVFHHLGQ